MTKSIKEYAMSIHKMFSLIFLYFPFYVTQASACPAVDLKNLQCETSDGYNYVIDYVRVEENIFSYHAFGIPVQMELPVVDGAIIKAQTYCDGNQIVTKERFKNKSAVVVTNFESDTMTIKGQSIVIKCDEVKDCRVGDYTFDKFINQDIVCQL